MSATFIVSVLVCALATTPPNNRSKITPMPKKIISTVRTLNFSMLYVIPITSSEALRNHLCVSSKVLADGANVSSCAHLQDNFIEGPWRRAQHHVAHAGIVCSVMAGTCETSTRSIEFHGTPCVRAPSTVRSVFALA